MNFSNKISAYYWPQWLITSISETKENKASLENFCNAQVHLWQALNIYDDFLDGDGMPEKLPEANNHYRLFLKTLYLLNLPKDFIKTSDNILKDLEAANLEEVRAQKIEIKNDIIIPPKNTSNSNDLMKLSRKSLSLAIMPIAAYLSANIKTDLNAQTRLVSFFRYLLSAKQLADDIYDWQEDLKNRKITEVTTSILKEIKDNKLKVKIDDNINLNRIFITKVSTPSAHKLIYLCSLARLEANKLNIDKESPMLKNLIKPLNLAARKSLVFKKML